MCVVTQNHQLISPVFTCITCPVLGLPFPTIFLHPPYYMISWPKNYPLFPTGGSVTAVSRLFFNQQICQLLINNPLLPQTHTHLIPLNMFYMDLQRVALLYNLFQINSLASGHHGDSWTNKPAKHDDRVPPYLTTRSS